MAACLLLYSVRRGRWRCFWFFPLWQHFPVLGRSIRAFPSQPAAAGLSWFLPSGNGWTGTWWQEIFQASDGQTIQLHSDIGQGCTWNNRKIQSIASFLKHHHFLCAIGLAKISEEKCAKPHSGNWVKTWLHSVQCTPISRALVVIFTTPPGLRRSRCQN